MNVGNWQVFKEIQYLQEDVKLALAVGCIDESLERGAGVIVMKDDQVYSIGVSVDGCLGVPGISSTKLPTRIDILCNKQVEELAAGYAHVVALTKSGHVYTWGQNEFSQLGLGHLSHKQRVHCIPQTVTGLSGHVVTKIACGFNHTLALTSQGIVFGWGSNRRPVDPSYTYDYVVDRPTEIKFSRKSTSVKIEAISCGRHFSMALTDMGKVYCWGGNSHGQLGLSIETPHCSVPRVLETQHKFKQIACGANHVVGLTTEGLCYMWGQKGNMRVPAPMRIGENLSAITEIGATYLAHTSALMASGRVYVWGQLKEKIDPTFKFDHVNLNEFLPAPYITECSSIDEAFNQWPSPAVMFRCFRPEMLAVQTARNALGACGGQENDFHGVPRLTAPFKNTAGATEVLGEGISSVVYKAVYNKKVAVKRMRSCGPQWRKTMVRELKALAAIGSHENIVELVGVLRPPAPYFPEPEDMCIVTEYCELGDLKTYLRKRRNFFHDQNTDGQIAIRRPITTDPEASTSGYVKYDLTDLVITTTDLVRWSVQFANGMAYLESQNIVHGDVALRNLLLTANKVVKVSDFGLSRPIIDKNYYKFDPKESFPWTSAAPETFDYRKISTASDVWGFGVTLWEIFTLGEVPYNDLFKNFSEEYKSAIRNGHRLARPEFATEHIYNVMASCWHLNPDSRPKFKQLWASLPLHTSHLDSPVETTSQLLTIERDARDGLNGTFCGIKVIPYWEIPFTKTATEILGEGRAGIVSTLVQGNKEFALKRPGRSGSEGMQPTVRELRALASIGNHKNIVQLVAIIKAPESFSSELELMCIVTEYCDLGNLQAFLWKQRHDFQDQIRDERIVLKRPLTSSSKARSSSYVAVADTDFPITTIDLVRWSKQLASGMAYLALENIVLGDLALRSLLLTSDNVVKLSGFGMSKQTRVSDDCTLCPHAMIAWTSAAPETLNDRKISTASDVWGFGVTLWEMFFLEKFPYKGSFNTFSKQFKNAIREGHRLRCPELATEQLYNVMVSCWRLTPDSRPKFEELLQVLSTIVE